MNIFTYRNLITAKIFTVLVAVSMILSALPAHIFVADAAAGDVVRLSDGALFADLQAAHDDIGTSADETLTLTADVTTSEQVTITKGIILDGGGFTISPNFTKTTNSNNAAIGVINAFNVSVQNLTINGVAGTNLHGVNVYDSARILLRNLTITDSDYSAVVVNGSEARIEDITTANSGWHAINVDLSTSSSMLASLLSIINTSTHGEISPLPTPHIYIDDISKNVTITDTNNQYEYVEGPNPLVQGVTARVYTLRQPVPEPVATIVATKIVCEDESMLPNWGNGATLFDNSINITQDTAEVWATVNQGCNLEEGWEFQWAPQGSFDPGDVLEGEADDPWTTFGPTDVNGMTTLTLTGDQIDGDSEIKIREVLQDGYIPFTHDQNGNTNEDDISAEIYCHTDVLNYDNDDRIRGIAVDETYYCVAFNAEVPTYTIDGHKWSDLNSNGQWDNLSENGLAEWKIALRPMDMDAEEELFVSAESAAITTSATTLVSGRTYVVEVSGTYKFGNRSDFVADAEWTNRNDSYQDAPLASHGWTVGELTYPSVVGLDLQIDGQNIVWGSFNDDHLYKTMIEGSDAPLDFSIFDSHYGDNTGGLNVTIYDVTDYVTTTDGSGYYSFDVPEGEYQIVEEMVEGWTQTYPTGPSYYHVTMPDMYQTEGYDFGNYNDTPESSLVITAPATDNEVLAPAVYTFEAEYVDADMIQDAMRWAIRPSCTSSVNLAGNVGGLSDPSTYDGAHFEADVDMSTWANGDYCFIVNPAESGGHLDHRELRPFTLEDTTPIVCTPGVNLIENPSFEEPIIASSWSLVTPVAWFVETLGGGSLLDMEIQKNVSGWLASEGEQYTELDSTESSQMSQMIDTVFGATYSLSWDFAGRPHREVLDNHLEVLVDGIEVADNQNAGGGDNIVDWESDSVTFTGNGNPMEIMFRDAGDSNSYGTFVDNVSLMCDPLILEAGPYCGDGEVNQEWEQCEIGDEGCTDYCTFANMCTDLKLVQINLNASDSVSFDDRIYLGSDSNPIPSGTWFNFDESGDNAMNVIGNNVNGLAVSRDLSTGKLVLGFAGANDSGELDIAIGSIKTMGIDLGAINRSPITQWNLEDGTGGSFSDVFAKNSLLNTIDFDMRADTGRDGVSVVIGDVDLPYNCPYSKPTNNTNGGNSSGTRISRSTPEGRVLGASASNQCPFLLDFMQMGIQNDTWEVMKLQAFLNEFISPMPVTGYFGQITDKNVKLFQSQYRDEILLPWFNKGIVGHTNPTGFVYKTTLWKINDIVCSEYAILPDLEGEDLTKNVDID